MPAPLRFLHAAGLWLDHSLSGTGPLPDELRRVAEDATLTAFDRLIDVAIERQVDFVLLIGDTFDERDASLRAAVALRDGCGRLAEQQIRVFALPGQADPALAWRSLGPLPENVTVVLARDEDAIAFVRDGQVVATIARIEPSPRQPHAGAVPTTWADSVRHRPLAIGLLSLDAVMTHSHEAHEWAALEAPQAAVVSGRPVESAAAIRDLPLDYIALGGRGGRQTHRTANGVAHHPGTLQGLDRRQPGQHGFTLVEVDESAGIHQQFVPAAPVRWEEFALPAGAVSSRDRLLEAMRRAWSGCRCEPGEQLWLVHWTVPASGLLSELLADESFLDDLRADLDQLAGMTAPARHSFELLAVDPRISHAARWIDSPLDFARFHLELGPPEANQQDILCRIAGADPFAASRLRSLVPRLDSRAIDEQAARLGSALFTPGPRPEPALR